MANTYYHNNWTGADASPATSGAMNTEYSSVATGLALAEAQMGRAIRVQAPDSIAALPASRVGKVLTFNGSGAPVGTILNDSTLFEDAATNLLPTTFASTNTLSISSGGGTEYIDWDGAPKPNIGGVWTKQALSFKSPGNVLIPSQAGLYLATLSADMIMGGTTTDYLNVTLMTINAVTGAQDQTYPMIFEGVQEDFALSSPGFHINMMRPMYYSGAANLGFCLQFQMETGTPNLLTVVNPKITFLRIARSASDI